MILLAGMVVGLVVGLLAGGSLRSLGANHLQFEWLFVAALGLYVAWPLAASSLGLGEEEFLLVWLASAAALVGLALINMRFAGMALVVAGLLLNIVVVAANSGMPVDLSKVGAGDTEAARASLVESPLHVEADGTTRVGFLGDILYIPGPSGLETLVSIGDVLLAVGAGVVVFQMMRQDSRVGSANTEDGESEDTHTT